MFIGIEIGGTKLQAGLGNGESTQVRLARTAVDPGKGRAGIVAQIPPLVERLLSEANSPMSAIAGIGIGFGGPVDTAAGKVLKSHQVGGWDDFPLRDWARETFGQPAFVGNDSDLAGWAEATLGAGLGCDPVVYMNIGSGIGGALVLGGRLYTGQGIGAMEIGHLRIEPRSSDQSWATLEALSSGWSLNEITRLAAAKARGSLLWKLADSDRDRMDARTLIAAVQQGDAAATDVWRQAIERWALALANVITLLCPQCVVLGGGVSLAGPTLLEPLEKAIRKQGFAPFADRWRLKLAELGEDVVVHGALRLAAQGAHQ